MLVGRKREREGKGGSPFIPQRQLLNRIPYAGWWRIRERKRKGGKLPFWREKNKSF
jgi:hypothetical protein